MTRPTYEELEEQVAYLKSELGLVAESDALHTLRLAMRVPGSVGRRGPAMVVMALYKAHGRTLSKHQIMEAVPPRSGGDDNREPKIIDVWVSRARKSLGRDAIENVWGQGARLSPQGMALVAGLLGERAAA